MSGGSIERSNDSHLSRGEGTDGRTHPFGGDSVSGTDPGHASWLSVDEGETPFSGPENSE
jgi:hypothetical protein